MWISISVFLLLVIGIVSVCDIRFTALFERMVKGNGNSTLADDLEVMSGSTPRGFFRRESYEIEQILKATGREGKFESVKTFAVIGFAAGCLLALILGNAFLVPVLGIAFAYIPVFYIRSTAGTYKKQLNAELETALSIITTSYLRTEDILKSVRENIDFINPPVKVHFEEFITESELINANTVSALNRLKLKIPNVIFHEWVNTLIRCQSDRTMKNTLMTITNRMITPQIRYSGQLFSCVRMSIDLASEYIYKLVWVENCYDSNTAKTFLQGLKKSIDKVGSM